MRRSRLSRSMLAAAVIAASIGTTMGFGQRPASADTLTYAIQSGVLQATNTSNTVVWTYSAPAGSVTGFVVSGTTVVATTTDCGNPAGPPWCSYEGGVAGLDAATGSTNWTFDEHALSQNPTVHAGVVFVEVSSGGDYIRHSRVHALNIVTGATVWTTSAPDGVNGAFFNGTLSIANSRVSVSIFQPDPLFFDSGNQTTTVTFDEMNGALAGGPVITIGSESIHEGNAGARILKFPVTVENLPVPTIAPFHHVVHYTITSGTATGAAAIGAGIDFNNAGGVTQVVDLYTGYISVPIYGDTAAEGDEQFTITLSLPTIGFVIGNASATGTIFDDDAVLGPSVGISDAMISEGTTGTPRKLTFNVALSGPVTAGVTLTFVIAPGSATKPADYTGSNVRVVKFAAGKGGVKTIIVSLVGGAIPEPDETFGIGLVGYTGVTAGQIIRSAGTGTITNDD